MPFASWMYRDPALICDRLIAQHERDAAWEIEIKRRERIRKARRIKKLTKMALAGKFKG